MSAPDPVAEVLARVANEHGCHDCICGEWSGSNPERHLAEMQAAALREAGLIPEATTRATREGGCGRCVRCNPGFIGMYVCAICGNKRCPCAGDCLAWKCSGSNDPNQKPEPR